MAQKKLSWFARRRGFSGSVARAAAAALLTVAMVAGAAYAPAQEPGFSRHRLRLERELGEILFEDLSGRGSKDVLVVELDRTTRDMLPHLKVFRHDGQDFRPLRSASTPLPPDVAMVGSGKFPFGPGLVLLSPTRLEIWPWRNGRFVSRAALRKAVTSIFVHAGGGLKTGLKWVVDLNGDGFHEIVMPRLDGFQVLRVNKAGRLEAHATLRTRPRSRLWFFLRQNYIAFELPGVHFLDVDGRGWKDVITFNNGLLRVFLLDAKNGGRVVPPLLVRDLRPPAVFEPRAPRDPPMKLVMGKDLNGDGLPDLVFIKNRATDSSFRTATRVLIYFGKRNPVTGLPDFDRKPSQVFASEGFTHPILLDLNHNGLVDMVLVNVEIGFWNAVKAFIARSVTAEAAFYPMEKHGRYPVQPKELVDYSVTFSLGRFSHQPITAFADLNSDGLPDLLLSENKESLGIHWGLREGVWDSDYDYLLEDFLPINTKGLRVVELDGDGRDDLVLLYRRPDIRQMPEIDRKITVLLSRFPKKGRELARSP